MSSHPILASVLHPLLYFWKWITFIESYVFIICKFKWKQVYILIFDLSYINIAYHKHHPAPSFLQSTMYPGLFLYSSTYTASLLINIYRQHISEHLFHAHISCGEWDASMKSSPRSRYRTLTAIQKSHSGHLSQYPLDNHYSNFYYQVVVLTVLTCYEWNHKLRIFVSNIYSM